MSALGIYFGPKVISIVETIGRKIINNIQIPQSTISAGELEEKVPAEVKIIGIIALFKEELRKNRIEAKEATLCLSGKDLVVRTFEIPLLPKEELKSAINFEVKKYIPFKVEDLISDFQLKFDKINRSNLALFIGIKKETLDRYFSILSQLNIKINAIEYSAFSVLRCLKLSGASDKGIMGIIGVDLERKDEVNFTVLEDGFPLFSRDITLINGPEQLEKPEEAQPALTLEKLKTEIRVSLDYYHRKFSSKNIKKIFLFTDQETHSELEAFLTDLGLSVKFIDVSRLTRRPMPYSLSFIKGYSSSLYRAVKTNIAVNLLAAKEKALITKEKIAQKEIVSFLRGFKLDSRVVALGIIICIAAFGWGLYRIYPLRQELKNVISARIQPATINADSSYEALTNLDSEYKRKLDALNSLIKKQLFAAELLDVIARTLPKGAWLTNVTLDNKEQGKTELVLEGMVSLSDTGKEFETVNEFVANLKEDPGVNKYFKNVNIASLDKRQVGQSTAVTNFLISCKAY